MRRLYPLLAGTESPGGYSPNHAHHPKWACKHLLAVSIMHAMRCPGVKERKISRAGDSSTDAGKPGQRRMRLLRSVLADGCDRRRDAGFDQDAELCQRCADNLGALWVVGLGRVMLRSKARTFDCERETG